ncbi:glycosyltransferase [Candidatus Saccharibacteria bacterium]|nr:glycosyltransferase [Candidatus Saccharibacteria bacterium]
MQAYLSKSRVRLAAAFALVAMALWTARHLITAVHIGSLIDYLYSYWILIVSFLVLVITIGLSYRERPKTSAAPTGSDAHVAAIIPAYNEDPAALQECIRSLFAQTRPPQEIYVVDDGSRVEYSTVAQWAGTQAGKHGSAIKWLRQDNSGKRHAQAHAIAKADQATIFITVDSDSVLDRHAIAELLKPFADPDVQSVAGLVLARNNRTNLLARITDLLFVTGQLTDRSMMSSLGSVLVNSGGLAAYRADVVRRNIQSYLHEEFFGHPVEFSDDSMLTLYALGSGKTIQQPTAFVFTMMPDRLSHHVRQQIRWMRGSFIRSWWRLKYLPPWSPGFIRQAVGWLQFVVTTTLLTLMLISRPSMPHVPLLPLIAIPILVGYAQALRYFAVHRSDEPLWSQLLTYALTPLAVLWSYLVLRPIRLYAAITCFRGSWGTRKSVEVTLQPRKRHWRTTINAALRYRIVFDSRYDYLMRSIDYTSHTPAAWGTAWEHYYASLNERQQQGLWNGFYAARERLASSEPMETSHIQRFSFHQRVLLRLIERNRTALLPLKP